MITMPLPRAEPEVITRPRSITPASWQRWLHDRAFMVVVITALAVSIAATWFNYSHHLTLLFSDAHAHLLIARRTFDNISPGLAQLGGVWLPLPHIIMLPFIWNNLLWTTGLAGAIASMISYVVAAVYVFLSARRLTHDDTASYIGALVFICNPNVLYLQSTPLSEPVLIATLSMACYYFLAWAQEHTTQRLIWAAGCTLLATLARYDGWALYIVLLVAIIVIGIFERHTTFEKVSNLLLFGFLAGLGIVLWFLWCWVIFGDPLYFQRGPFSSQQQQLYLIQHGLDNAYHSPWGAISTYVVDSMENMGPILFILGMVAVVVFLMRRGINTQTVAALTFLTPLLFYVIALYTGQAVIFVPHAVAAAAPNPWYNVRYGSEIVAPSAVFLATLIRRIPLAKLALVGTLGIQTVLTATGGLVTLQEGQFGLSCYNPPQGILRYFAQHYDGGLILNDPYNTLVDTAVDGIPFNRFVYQGTNTIWNDALQDPSQFIEWVIERPARPGVAGSTGDIVFQQINQTILQNDYELVTQAEHGDVSLFRRKGLPPVPNRPLPADLATNYYAQCGTYKAPKSHS